LFFIDLQNIYVYSVLNKLSYRRNSVMIQLYLRFIRMIPDRSIITTNLTFTQFHLKYFDSSTKMSKSNHTVKKGERCIIGCYGDCAAAENRRCVQRTSLAQLPLIFQNPFLPLHPERRVVARKRRQRAILP